MGFSHQATKRLNFWQGSRKPFREFQLGVYDILSHKKTKAHGCPSLRSKTESSPKWRGVLPLAPFPRKKKKKKREKQRKAVGGWGGALGSSDPPPPTDGGRKMTRGKWFAPGEALPPGFVAMAHPEGVLEPQASGKSARGRKRGESARGWGGFEGDGEWGEATEGAKNGLARSKMSMSKEGMFVVFVQGNGLKKEIGLFSYAEATRTGSVWYHRKLCFPQPWTVCSVHTHVCGFPKGNSHKLATNQPLLEGILSIRSNWWPSSCLDCPVFPSSCLTICCMFSGSKKESITGHKFAHLFQTHHSQGPTGPCFWSLGAGPS